MDDFTRQYLDLIHQETTERGQQLMNHLSSQGYSDAALQYAGSRISTAQHKTDIDRLAQEIAPEFQGGYDPIARGLSSLAPAAGTILGGAYGGPAGAGLGGAMGVQIKQLVHGENTLAPGSVLETGLAGVFGPAMVSNPLAGIAGTAPQGLAQTAGAYAGQQAMMDATSGLASQFVNPEEHPWKHLALSGAMFMGVNPAIRGLQKLKEVMPGTPTSSLVDILSSEKGSAAVPNLAKGYEENVASKLDTMKDWLLQKNIPIPSFLERQIGNTGEQWLNTPFDILQKKEGGLKKVGESLEDTARESERMRQALAQSASMIGDKPLDWLNDYRNVIKGGFNLNKASEVNRQEIADVLQPTFEALTTARSKLTSSVQEEALVDLTVKKQLGKLMASNIHDPHLQMAMDAFQGDLTTSAGTKQFLDSIISHSGTPPDTRQIALDLYNIRAKTVQEVSQAWRQGFEKVLISRIVENPEAAIPMSEGANAWIEDMQLGRNENQLKDFVKAPERYKELQGLLIHHTVAEGLQDLDSVPSAARRFVSTYYMNPWRTMRVGLTLPARLRDPISQMLFNDVAGKYPLSPMRVDQYARAAKLIRNNEAEYKAWKYWSGQPGALNDVDILPILESMKHDAGPLDNMLRMIYDPHGFKIPFMDKQVGTNPMGYVTQYASTIMRTFDTLTKMAKFDWNLKHGMEERAAAVDALRANGDPLRMSRAVKGVKDYAMPFFGWQSHALKTMAYGIAHHPVRVGKYFAIPAMMQQAAIDNLGMSDEEWRQFKQSLPEYVKDEVMGMPTFIPMPVRDEKGRIQMFNLAWWIPGLQDMAELQQRSGSIIGLVQHPAFTMGAALSANKKFSGAPIWNEWDPTDTKLGKALGFISEQVMPSMMPGVGNAWQKIVDSMGEDPNALTPAEALGGQLGYKVTPFEPAQQMQKHQNLLKSWEADAMRQFRKEIAKHPDNETEQSKIREKYTKLLTNIQSKRIGGGEE